MNRCLVLSPPAGGQGRNVVRDFLYGCWCNGRRIGGTTMPPLNLLYIATVLRESGFAVACLDGAVEEARFAGVVENGFSDFDFIIMMVATHSFRADAELLALAKQRNPAVRTVICGAHPTTSPAAALGHAGIDYIVCGEPEFALRDLLLALRAGRSPAEVRGIGYRRGEAIELTEAYPFIAMDELPIPDRSFLPAGVDYFNPVVHRVPYTTMQTSRGCPGKCIYCSVPVFYGRRLRVRSLEKVKEEIRQLLAAGYREIFFRDETFTAFRERNQLLCEWLIAENLGLSWIANARVDMIDEPMIRLMRRAGCHMLKIGVESGCDGILAAIGKGTTADQARTVFAAARRAGMETHAHLVLGSPGETEATIRETLRFLIEIEPTTASFGILTPYPGTPLFDRVKNRRLGDGTGADMEHLHTTAFFNGEFGSQVTGRDLERWVARCYRSFYLRPRYLAQWLPRITDAGHLWRLLIAGSNILSFSCTGKK